MAGIVYLRTNRFEVKLEGITFKAKEFESLCTVDFLFPDGKIWACPPVVGLDIMHHPRDPTITLMLLCFGVGCLILRFRSAEQLPDHVLKFLTDKRIRFVGFGIPEKKDLFPFEELGLTKDKVDIGYLATKFFNDPKYKRCELGELARKVLGVKRMIGLAEASSFERHEQIKCAICQLFISSVIAMSFFSTNDKKKTANSPKKSSFLKNLSSLPLLTEGWFKLPRAKKEEKKKIDTFQTTKQDIQNAGIKHKESTIGNDFIHAKSTEHTFSDNFAGFWGGEECVSEGKVDDHSPRVRSGKEGYGNGIFRAKVSEEKVDDGSAYAKPKEFKTIDDWMNNEAVCSIKRPLKGILKCPSSGLESWNASSSKSNSPLSMDSNQQSVRGSLRRANSKGFNVSFI